MPWVPLEDSGDVQGFLRRFKKKPRFLIDEDVDADLADYLRDQGYNAISVVEAGLRGADDEAVWQRARSERRILVTRNGKHFSDDRRFPIDQSPGVAILGSQDKRAAIHCIRLMGKWGELWVGCKATFTAEGELSLKQREHDSGAVTTGRYRFTKRRRPERWVED